MRFAERMQWCELDRVRVCLFRYDGMPTEELKRYAFDKWGEYLQQERIYHRSFLAGRIAALALLEREQCDMAIEKNKTWGYLFLKTTHPQRYLSISHTERDHVKGIEEVSISVLSSFPIGIDIEPISRRASRVLPRICYPEEKYLVQQSLTKLSLTPEALCPSIVIWSLKEAIMKAYGVGLHHSFKNVVLKPHPHYQADSLISGRGDCFLVDTQQSFNFPFKLNKPAVLWYLEAPWIIAISTEASLLA